MPASHFPKIASQVLTRKQARADGLSQSHTDTYDQQSDQEFGPSVGLRASDPSSGREPTGSYLAAVDLKP